MLTPPFYRGYRVLPTAWFNVGRMLWEPMRLLSRARFQTEGLDLLPQQPALIATNSSQRYDFVASRAALVYAGVRSVTVTKAKNYHSAFMGAVLRRTGVVPLASRGYFILADFIEVVGRRPTDPEYRALRDHLDHNTPLPAGTPFDTIAAQPRMIVGTPFDPALLSWSATIQAIYAASMAQTVRLAGEAVAAGHHIQMYPEGTVSPTLGPGRIGAVQLALALDLPIVPVGMSGCPGLFWGQTPLLRGGTMTMRFGAPYRLGDIAAGHVPFAPASERQHRPALQAATDDLMDRINALLDEPFRRQAGPAPKGKGTRAHL
jgi:Acyltransferase